MEHGISSDDAAEVAQVDYDNQIREQLVEAEAEHNQGNAAAQGEAEAEAPSETYQNAQTQGLFKAEAEVQTLTGPRMHARTQEVLHPQHNHAHSQPQSVDTSDIASDSGHDSESFRVVLDGAMDSTMADDVFSGASGDHITTADAAIATNNTMQQAASSNGAQAPAKFEETMTLSHSVNALLTLRKNVTGTSFTHLVICSWLSMVKWASYVRFFSGRARSRIHWSARDKEHLGEEISDVLIYLVRLADKCDVNLPAALNDKIAKNAQKYPAELVRGSSTRHSEYKRMRIAEESTL
ncbi:unnamed protein product [Peronospora belbahrii]|uniref:NTP pyrophosphohydrolase MazG putative catalytic core domain-containing protein n=1 Tax=Peronospora belbahrii TaxID=622444 RepID=A0ABN8D5U7_9STRA|nr:unnamed protein product [Peronospora belbahrii]